QLEALGLVFGQRLLEGQREQLYRELRTAMRKVTNSTWSMMGQVGNAVSPSLAIQLGGCIALAEMEQEEAKQDVVGIVDPAWLAAYDGEQPRFDNANQYIVNQ
ncbi:hypothetical protein HaLaN_30662, partial [Haematococcus lacustris]